MSSFSLLLSSALLLPLMMMTTLPLCPPLPRRHLFLPSHPHGRATAAGVGTAAVQRRHGNFPFANSWSPLSLVRTLLLAQLTHLRCGTVSSRQQMAALHARQCFRPRQHELTRPWRARPAAGLPAAQRTGGLPCSGRARCRGRAPAHAVAPCTSHPRQVASADSPGLSSQQFQQFQQLASHGLAPAPTVWGPRTLCTPGGPARTVCPSSCSSSFTPSSLFFDRLGHHT